MTPTRTCPSCGADSEGARFCIRCGFAFPAPIFTAPTLPSVDLSDAAAEALRRGLDPVPQPATRPNLAARHVGLVSDVVTPRDPGSTDAPAESMRALAETRPAPPDSALLISEQQILAAIPIDAARSLLGLVLAGRYRIDSLLGEGGFGAVYTGTHLALGERVAIKLLHAEWAVQPEFRVRFQREAVALSRLRHPHIVTVLDVGESEGRPFLVMELVHGRSLGRAIAEGPDVMTGPRVARLFEQVLQALEAAHALGIVHRDMKPDNVLLTSDRLAGGDGQARDWVKLLDFGIALVEDQEGGRLTATNAVQGTPLYMSPEQCRGRDVGPPTDVYAVGAMLYEALAGEPPFSGDSSTDLMVKHMFMVPPPIVERGWKHVPPPELEALASWALAKRPEERPSASELRQSLMRAAQGVDPVSRAVRAVEGRVASEALSREDRALPLAPHSQVETMPRPRDVSQFAGQGHQVLMWAFGHRERAESLRAALAVNGILAISWVEQAPPPTAIGGAPVKAVVVVGDARAESLARTLRASAISGKLPLMVIDVEAPEAIPVLIRAGASDVSLSDVGDEGVCRKVWRLIQRGR